jgi:hypothetical protein
LEEFGRIHLIQCQAAGIAGVEILQSETLAFDDPKRGDVLLEGGLENLFSQLLGGTT